MSSNNSSRAGVRLAMAAAGLAVVGGAFAAEQMSAVEEITISAERPTTTIVGRTSSGAPIELAQLRYRVSYGDLDLNTHAGATELDKRVSDAAAAACKELDKLYPLEKPDPTCVKKAVDSASAQVRAAVIGAENRAKGMKK
jgi:UrcA family protein